MPDNRIARLVSQRTFEVKSERVPEPEEGRVLVRVVACGVCASELHAWEDPLPEYPITMGHEPVGVVEEAGAGEGGFSVGAMVTGRFGPTFCDYLLVDPRDLVAVPAGLGIEDAMGEPLGCVVEGFRRTPLELGDRVAVVGAGYMGALMLELLRVGGLGPIVAIDPRPDARRLAVELGAGEAYDPADPPIGELTGAFDVVIESSGTQSGLDLATEMVREHGAISILGFHQGARRSVDVEAWNWKAIDVINAHVRRRDLLNDAIRRGLELVQQGRIRPARLVTHRSGLEGIDDAFRALSSKPEGFVKAVVVNERA